MTLSRVKGNIPKRVSTEGRACLMAAAWSLNTVLLVFLCVLKEHAIESDTKDCYQAVSDCRNDSKCARMLQIYEKECKSIVNIFDIFSNTSMFPCSSKCVNSIKSMMQTTKGAMLWKCECNQDGECLTLKTRSQKCLTIANGTYRKRTGCSVVQAKCLKNSKCKQAQKEFLRKCSKLFSSTNCTANCLSSQKKLFSLAIGRSLMDCECDGLEELYCLVLRAHAERLKCYWKNWKNWKNRRDRKRKRCKRQRQNRKHAKQRTQRKVDNKCGRRGQRKKD